MKVVIYRNSHPPITIDDGYKVSIETSMKQDPDRFDIRETDEKHRGLYVRLEEHKGALGQQIAVFPHGGNSISLKGVR